MGRPLVGQWCWDVIRALDFLLSRDDADTRHLSLLGTGAGGLVAICAAALDERVRSVATTGLLASFASAEPPQGHRMATFVPFILDVGDVPHLSALVAPRRLIVARPVDAQNQTLNGEAAPRAFAAAADAYRWYSATSEFRIAAALSDDEIAKSLRGQ
jgi:hypothetical protein